MSDSPTIPTLFSIGHSNHPLEKFLTLLREHSIDVLADVRSRPYSRFAPHFNHKALCEALSGAGRKYLFLGKELGGRPEGDEFYDADGRVLYDRFAESPLFHAGIALLENETGPCRVAIMCAEENPAHCHRWRLVSRALKKRGVSVLHIRGDGRLQSDDDVSADVRAKGNARQLNLFADSPRESE